MRNLLKRLLGTASDVPKHAPGVIPVVNFADTVQAREFDLRVVDPEFSDGNVSLYELFVINSLVQITSPNSIFEIGTFNGRTTLNMAANSKPHTRIVTLDLPSQDLANTRFALDAIEAKYVNKPESGERFRARPEAAKITQIYGDSAQFDFTPYHSSMDFVFVDASHAYEYVINDSKIALNLLRDGRGTILWHDYDRSQWWPGVTKALDELNQKDVNFANLVHIEGTSLVLLRLP